MRDAESEKGDKEGKGRAGKGKGKRRELGEEEVVGRGLRGADTLALVRFN